MLVYLLIWIIDQLVDTFVLSKKEASNKIKQLVDVNFVFQNNPQLMNEIEKRLKLWI